MNRHIFVEPCGIKNTRTGEVEYFETSTAAKEALAAGFEFPTEFVDDYWEMIDAANTQFLEDYVAEQDQ